jgi:hypothetical protein
VVARLANSLGYELVRMEAEKDARSKNTASGNSVALRVFTDPYSANAHPTRFAPSVKREPVPLAVSLWTLSVRSSAVDGTVILPKVHSVAP